MPRLKKKKFKKTYCSANIFTVEMTHTDYQNGDAGHGCFVELNIIPEANHCMIVDSNQLYRTEPLKIGFYGDCEKQTLIHALNDILFHLENDFKVIQS